MAAASKLGRFRRSHISAMVVSGSVKRSPGRGVPTGPLHQAQPGSFGPVRRLPLDSRHTQQQPPASPSAKLHDRTMPQHCVSAPSLSCLMRHRKSSAALPREHLYNLVSFVPLLSYSPVYTTKSCGKLALFYKKWVADTSILVYKELIQSGLRLHLAIRDPFLNHASSM